MVVFVLIGALWGLAFTGFPYAIALKTASPGAVGASFILFFPFAFLTSSTVPLDQLSGWLRTVARYNPITYILESMRSLTGDTWQWAELGKGRVAGLVVATVSQGLALMALRGRLDRG